MIRKPLYGLVPAGQTIAVNVMPPIDPQREHVSFLTLRPAEVTWQVVKADAVVVQNRGVYPAPFVIGITPTGMALPTPAGLLAMLRAKFAEWKARKLG